MKPDQPNLLFIWTDEQAYNTMKAYGNDKIKMPNLNKLSETSVVFERTYVTQPVCSPSRSSVMTGYWPHQTEITYNNLNLNKETKTLAELLEGSDYTTAYMGKWHLGDEIFKQRGFDEWVSIEDSYGKYYTKGRKKSARSSYWHWLREKGYKSKRRNGKFSRNFAASLPFEHSKPAFLEEKACDFLRRNKDRPFVLYVNYLEPHMPFTGPLNDFHPIDDIELPPTYHNRIDVNEPRRIKRRREEAKKKYLSTDQDAKALIQRYWGLCSQVDRSVGGILDSLKKQGLEDKTIVIFTSDHGDMMGAHKLVGKSLMYEESTRVPFLVRIPWLTPAKTVFRNPVSQIDFMPTILDFMSLPIPKELSGVSLRPNLEQGVENERDVFIQWNPNTRKQPKIAKKLYDGDAEVNKSKFASIRSVVSGNWKLHLCDYDLSQLFNLAKDPYEQNNCIDEAENAEVLADLTRKIHRWQTKIKDIAPPL